MHELGITRSVFRRDHLLQTPDSFVRAPLPGMHKATAVIHVAPPIGAKFTQYTAEFDSGGKLGPTALQRFVYVLEGEIHCQDHGLLRSGDFAYIPASSSEDLLATMNSRAVVIEKPYQSLPNFAPPQFVSGSEDAAESKPLMGDAALQVRSLLPSAANFDFAVNVMTYQPGAALPMVEIHVMEHGLLMLAGGGIYRLNDCWYPVTAGDFIWIAPYCPQWFGALGKSPAKYLIYKDWNRDPS